MSDVFSKAKRSEVMSRIRSRGNKATELALVKLFRRHKITGWRRQIQIRTSPAIAAVATPQHGEGVKVRPDFIFRQSRLAVFVDGCFWHVCPKHGTKPKGNRTFWKRKFARNQARDRLVNRTLRLAKWRVIRIWECRLRKSPQSCVNRILRALH